MTREVPERQRILLTGAGGFIGRNLREALSQSACAITAWRTESDGSLLAREAVAAFAKQLKCVDAWIHCAWSPSGSSNYGQTADHHLWTRRTLELLDVAEGAGVHSVLFGSVFDRPDRTSEDRQDPYCQAKRELRNELVQRPPQQWCLISPSYIFSPTEGRPSVVRDFVSHAGDWGQVRQPQIEHDFIHIHDVVASTREAVARQRHGVLEIGSGRMHSVRQLLTGLDHPAPCSGDCSSLASWQGQPVVNAEQTSRYFHGEWRPAAQP